MLGLCLFEASFSGKDLRFPEILPIFIVISLFLKEFKKFISPGSMILPFKVVALIKKFDEFRTAFVISVFIVRAAESSSSSIPVISFAISISKSPIETFMFSICKPTHCPITDTKSLITSIFKAETFLLSFDSTLKRYAFIPSIFTSSPLVPGTSFTLETKILFSPNCMFILLNQKYPDIDTVFKFLYKKTFNNNTRKPGNNRIKIIPNIISMQKSILLSSLLINRVLLLYKFRIKGLMLSLYN